MSNVRYRFRKPSSLSYHKELHDIANRINVITSCQYRYIGKTNKAKEICNLLNMHLIKCSIDLHQADRINVSGYTSASHKYSFQERALCHAESILRLLEEIRFTGHYYGKSDETIAAKFGIRYEYIDETAKMVSDEIERIKDTYSKTKKQYDAWEQIREWWFRFR